MIWTLDEPRRGDMIRVKLGSIYHYGIYVSDDEVVQFGLAPVARKNIPDSEIEVCTSDIDAFACGGFIEAARPDRREAKKNRTPDATVEYARAKIGSRGYNILYNNCEHFAYECLTGTPYCSQADDVRQMFRRLPLVDVYIAEIPEDGEIDTVIPKERDEEITEVSNERVRREKYYVWRLLEYGLERTLGIRMKKAELKKSPTGRWESPLAHFSLSHSDGVAVVAISRDDVGVDIERLSAPRSERFAERILTEGELSEYLALDGEGRVEFLVEKWTAKESIFKSLGESSFIPGRIEVSDYSVRTERVSLFGEEYILSVASRTPEKLRLFTDIKLK